MKLIVRLKIFYIVSHDGGNILIEISVHKFPLYFSCINFELLLLHIIMDLTVMLTGNLNMINFLLLGH